MKKFGWSLAIFAFLSLTFAPPVSAAEGSVMGIHILHPAEVLDAKELIKPEGHTDQWSYVTIPLSLNDLQKKDEWQNFFVFAKKEKIIPIVRLTTKFENGSWKVPTKKEVVRLMSFLSELDWPTEKRYIIAFNEVNHAKEWGGTLDPAGYADVLKFTSNWANSENKNYQVLPAAMDLAAPNSGATREAFTYLEEMRQADPDIFSYISYWNSHSYPNPGFSSSPERTGKESLRGFTLELEYLKQKTGKEYQTFITETGWVETFNNRHKLTAYYEYAAEKIWSDSRVIAVTPFILRGDPGPFSGFTFLNRNDEPTYQYLAYQNAIKKHTEK